MKLSVVILNYNVRYFLELCLKSVQDAIVDLDAEIIVVDNCSSDDSCQMVKALFPTVILIENKENFGFSKGNNIGVAEATGDYLCILNPDTVVSERAFKKCLAYADDKPQMGVLGCQLIDGRGEFLPESKRNIPTPLVSIKKIMGFSKAYYANHLLPSENGEVDILVGAFMILRKIIYEEVKGFDEDYFMYGEDIDLSYKVLKAGYQNFYFGEVCTLHYKGESTFKDKTYARHFYGAMQMFYNKHFKSHSFYNIMVWFGIRLSRLFLKSPSQNNEEVESRVFLSANTERAMKFPFKVEVGSSFWEISPNTQVIFDGNTIDFETIVECMRSSDASRCLTFRILPKSARFIIGSDSSKQRGEVVLF